jgi:hypothetical protein
VGDYYFADETSWLEAKNFVVLGLRKQNFENVE